MQMQQRQRRQQQQQRRQQQQQQATAAATTAAAKQPSYLCFYFRFVAGGGQVGGVCGSYASRVVCLAAAFLEAGSREGKGAVGEAGCLSAATLRSLASALAAVASSHFSFRFILLLFYFVYASFFAVCSALTADAVATHCSPFPLRTLSALAYLSLRGRSA